MLTAGSSQSGERNPARRGLTGHGGLGHARAPCTKHTRTPRPPSWGASSLRELRPPETLLCSFANLRFPRTHVRQHAAITVCAGGLLLCNARGPLPPELQRTIAVNGNQSPWARGDTSQGRKGEPREAGVHGRKGQPREARLNPFGPNLRCK